MVDEDMLHNDPLEGPGDCSFPFGRSLASGHASVRPVSPRRKQGESSYLATSCLKHDQKVVQFRFETTPTFGEVRLIEL